MATKLTMADVKRKSAAAGSNYFDKGNSKFFGGDKFYGPYSGKGGTFFVQHNRAGWKIKRFGEDHRVHPVAYDGQAGAGGETIRDAAKRMAKGT